MTSSVLVPLEGKVQDVDGQCCSSTPSRRRAVLQYSTPGCAQVAARSLKSELKAVRHRHHIIGSLDALIHFGLVLHSVSKLKIEI